MSLVDLISFDDDGLIVDREHLESVVSAGTGGKPKAPAVTFPTPAGSGWEDVNLFVEDLHVRVRVGQLQKHYGFAEAGFEDGRKRGVPNEIWELLKLFALNRGRLPSGPKGQGRKPVTVKHKVSRLRTLARQISPNRR